MENLRVFLMVIIFVTITLVAVSCGEKDAVLTDNKINPITSVGKLGVGVSRVTDRLGNSPTYDLDIGEPGKSEQDFTDFDFDNEISDTIDVGRPEIEPDELTDFFDCDDLQPVSNIYYQHYDSDDQDAGKYFFGWERENLATQFEAVYLLKKGIIPKTIESAEIEGGVPFYKTVNVLEPGEYRFIIISMRDECSVLESPNVEIQFTVGDKCSFNKPYLDSKLGLDTTTPSFTWRIFDAEVGYKYDFQAIFYDDERGRDSDGVFSHSDWLDLTDATSDLDYYSYQVSNGGYLQYNKSYYVKLGIKEDSCPASSYTWSDLERFELTCENPQPTSVNVYPAPDSSGIISTQTPTIRWTKHCSDIRYFVYIEDNNANLVDLYDAGTDVSSFLTTNKLEKGKKYWAYISAMTQDGEAHFSTNDVEFTIFDDDPCAGIDKPTNFSVTGSGTDQVTLHWSVPRNNSGGYFFKVVNLDEAKTYGQSSVDASTTSYTMKDLNDGQYKAYIYDACLFGDANEYYSDHGNNWVNYTPPSGSPYTGPVSFEYKEEQITPCSTIVTSGGYEVSETVISLGQENGTFHLVYEFYDLKDSIRIYYAGTSELIYSSGGFVSGCTMVSIPFVNYSEINVQVIGGESDTKWDYIVGCPNDSPPTCNDI